MPRREGQALLAASSCLHQWLSAFRRLRGSSSRL
jgi:hypothetical protein